jgi:glucose-6-phosphate 1-dehydrogenase
VPKGSSFPYGPKHPGRRALKPGHVTAPLELTARIDPPELPAYGQFLLDVLNGNAALSIRGDEAEEAWRVVAPVLSAWSKDLLPMLEYPAGSQGPDASAGSPP